jgi:hypothetical protein
LASYHETKAIPGQPPRVPEGWGSQFRDSWHMRMVRLSALRTCRLYLPENIPGTHFYYRLSRTQDHIAAGKIPMAPSGIEPVTFPACSAVSQQTASPRVRQLSWTSPNFKLHDLLDIC